MGVCGYGWETPADARLVLEDDGSVTFYDGTPGATLFPSLPDAGPVMEFVDGAVLDKSTDALTVRLKSGLIYYFPKPQVDQPELLVEKVGDRCGNYLSYFRTSAGLKEIRESAGRSIDVKSENGRVMELRLRHPAYKDPHPLVRFDYDSQGNLVAVYDALNHAYRFAYEQHRLVKHTDRNGLSFYYEYEPNGTVPRCVHSWGDGGLYNYHFEYDDLLIVTQVTDSLGYTSVVEFDERHLPIKETDPLGGETLFEYDAVGRTSAVVDADGHRTEYAYDNRGNLLRITRPDGAAIVTEYDNDNNVVSMTDPNGSVWQQRWDACRLLASQISPLGSETQYEYNARGQLVGHTNPRGATTTFNFDQYENLTRLTDALGHHTEFVSDALGNVCDRTDALGHHTRYSYDAKGRLIDAVFTSGVKIACAYDREDNLVRYVDENGAVTRLEYCGLGEIKRRLQPDGHVVEYDYDTEERLIRVTNQRGERFEIKRDAAGQILEEIDYWGQLRRYAYTAAGYLKESMDPLGRIVRYETDPLGQILKKVLPDPHNPGGFQEEVFTYDCSGNAILAQNAHIKIERKFDLEGRLVAEQQGEACLVSNAYDANGNRIARTIKIETTGHTHMDTVSYQYDLLDQAIVVEEPGHAPIELTRDALGQVTSERLSPHLVRRRTYHPDGHLTAQELHGNQAAICAQSFTYDRAANLIEKHDTVLGIEQFTYDPIGRVVAHVNTEGHVQEYLNDPAGSQLRTSVRTGAVERLDDTQWYREGQHNSVSYCFDRAGNLIERVSARDRTHFSWDANQRLVQTATEGLATTYRYDPFGRRISKTTGHVSTQFYWDGDSLLADAETEDAGPGRPARHHVRQWIHYPGTFEPLALVVLQPPADVLEEPRTATTRYLYHNDPNGCPTQLLDPSSEVVWSAKYGAWAQLERLLIERVDNPLRMQGQYEDKETGLYYNRHRYYFAPIGQFVSPDPFGLIAGENTYQFGPNAHAWIDPLGLSCRAPKVTKKGIARIERHLTKTPGLVPGAAEFRMLERLKAGKRTPHDLRFYEHELIESRMIKKTRKLFSDPVDAVREAHHRTLIKQGLYRRGYESEIYAPEALALF